MTASKIIEQARQHIAAGNEESGLAILTAGIRSSLSTTQANKYRRALADLGWLASSDNPTIHDLEVK